MNVGRKATQEFVSAPPHPTPGVSSVIFFLSPAPLTAFHLSSTLKQAKTFPQKGEGPAERSIFQKDSRDMHFQISFLLECGNIFIS